MNIFWSLMVILSEEKMKLKLYSNSICCVNILHNISFCVLQKKESYAGLEQCDGK